ncbi:MAG: DsbC family protein [Halieaceae bacterium]|uniref:DsbC family protein n=1 Tax=Haliea alexandrii TaxID=2448162 RepID=UPI000F0BC4A1|nr:DsbC family protein [Haliea alexandrii]MCR9183971.1 DsbC family protein [Halieaceae bacterium]
MINRVLTVLLACLFAGAVVSVRAADPVPADVADSLRQMLESPADGLKVATIEPSEIEGMYAVQLVDGPLVYASRTGQFFIVGDLFTVGPAGYVNLAEKRRDGERAERLATLSPADMIIFPAKGETRSHITVFTDVTCFYCQKLHREVPELNKRGVEVRYLAYPRSGLASEGYRKLATAWCANDRADVLTRLKNGESVAENVCQGSPVADQYQLGQSMGVRGTPAIITASGQMIPGYQPADELMGTLGLQ